MRETDRKQWVERLKTAGIVLLLALAAVLGEKIGLFENLLTAKPVAALVQGTRQLLSSGGDVAGETGETSQVILPLAVVVTLPEGERYGAYLDGAAVSAAYEKFSAALAEALGSAGTSEKTDETAVRSSLEESSMFLDFGTAVSLADLADWLGVELSAQVPEAGVSRLCLLEGDDGVVLCCFSDGEWRACRTGLPAGSVRSRTREFEPNGAQFVYEYSGGLTAVDPWFVVLRQLPELPTVTAKNPFRSGNDVEEILESFGLNAFVASSYPETDGTRVFVDGERTLRVSPFGDVTFRGMEHSGVSLRTRAAEGSMPACITEVCAWLRDLTTPYGGVQELYYTGCIRDEESCTLYFDYFINGIPVRIAGREHAVQVQIQNYSITYMSICFKEYAQTTEYELPIPPRLMLASCQLEGGGSPLLCYEDNGAAVEAYWTIR